MQTASYIAIQRINLFMSVLNIILIAAAFKYLHANTPSRLNLPLAKCVALSAMTAASIVIITIHC